MKNKYDICPHYSTYKETALLFFEFSITVLITASA